MMAISHEIYILVITRYLLRKHFNEIQGRSVCSNEWLDFIDHAGDAR
jgi:hypothetical protein